MRKNLSRWAKWTGIVLAFVALLIAITLSGGIYQSEISGDQVIITNRFTGETWVYIPQIEVYSGPHGDEYKARVR